MRLINLFTREEPIIGLEVSDTHLRLALLGLSVKPRPGAKPLVEVRALAKEPLADGAIVEGTLRDKAKFAAALNSLLKKAHTTARYVIVSLPADPVFSHIYSFPRSIRGVRLEESMRLTVGFQLPVKTEDVYLDWEKTADTETNEIFLATIEKTVVNEYLEAFNATRLKVIAIEFHPVSFARVIAAPKDLSVLYIVPGKTSAGIFIVKNGTVRFSRTMPGTGVPPQDEIRKIKDFYEAEAEPISKIVHLDDAGLSGQFADVSKAEAGKWLISIGAAYRGLLPRATDQIVSLMPIGTEKAYEYQKASVFAEFLSNVTIGISVFFAAAFVGSWLLLRTVQQDYNEQLDQFVALAIPADTVALEERAVKLNQTLDDTVPLLDRIPQWSIALEDLRSIITPGITITSLTMSGAEATWNMSGVAGTRAQLNEFRKAVESSPLFTETRIPLTNLEQRETISFSVSLKLAQPERLFEY